MSSKRKYEPAHRKITENPRYKHVKPVVDTGASMTKYLEQLEETRRNYKFRKDEIFRRLKVTTFAQLILQVVSPMMEEEDEVEPVSIPSLPPYPSPPSTARSTLSDLVSGVGELDVSTSSTTSQQTLTPTSTPNMSLEEEQEECPYLLLDVRSNEDYRKSHIVTALNYPSLMLSRSCNPFTKEMHYYKNRPGCIIVLYDEDESLAPEVATKLVQRDFDNIFMLSGGMKVLYKMFPDGFITGIIPRSCLPSPSPSSVLSRRSPSSRYTKQPVAAVVEDKIIKESFSSTDLLCIQRKLDEVLLNGSSSRASSSRSSSVASSRLSSSSTSRPWK